MKHWATAGYLPPKAIDFWFLIRVKKVVRSKEKNLKNEDTDTNRRHHDEDRKNHDEIWFGLFLFNKCRKMSIFEN